MPSTRPIEGGLPYDNRGSRDVPFGFIYSNTHERRNGYKFEEGRVVLFGGGGWPTLTDVERVNAYHTLEQAFPQHVKPYA